MDLVMDAPLGASLGDGDDTQPARVIWLDTGRAHILLKRRLRVGSEWPLHLPHEAGDFPLGARVLAVRVRPEIKEGPRVLHLCSLIIPSESHLGLEALLRAVNPTAAPPERKPPPVPEPAEEAPEEDEDDWDFDELAPDPEPKPEPEHNTEPPQEQARKVNTGAPLEESRRDTTRARQREEGRAERERKREGSRSKARTGDVPRSTRRRLPPQRRLSSHIPRSGDGTAKPVASTKPRTDEHRTETREDGKRGLRTAELVRPEFHHGDPPVIVATFGSTDLFCRSTRTGEGWLQLTLTDVEDVPGEQDLSLELILPTGVQVHVIIQVARRGRGRMILETRQLSQGAQESIRLVT
jgi:hypothetical protein